MNIKFNIRKDGVKTIVLPKNVLNKDKRKRPDLGVKNLLNSTACNLIDSLKVTNWFYNQAGNIVLEVE